MGELVVLFLEDLGLGQVLPFVERFDRGQVLVVQLERGAEVGSALSDLGAGRLRLLTDVDARGDGGAVLGEQPLDLQFSIG